MNKVYIAGIGQTPVSESWDKSLKELAGDAGLMAMNDAGIGYPDALFVGNMMAITANRQAQLATLWRTGLVFITSPPSPSKPLAARVQQPSAWLS
jgi:acetyl-CoA acetyltransferase